MTFQLENAHGYLDRVIAELHALRTEKKQPLVSVLQYLSDHIRNTRAELGALRPKGLASTADELEEVVAETARAANEIMAAAEAIERLMPEVDAQVSAALLAAVTRIYEASAFQDITGQRITKIIRAVQGIEGKLDTLVRACGADGEADAATGDAALLNGPQLGRSANTQDDIDALFEFAMMGAAAAAIVETEIADADRDALHILPLATLPVAHPVLRRARLVKNTRLDAAVEIFNAPGCGSGQFDVPVISKLLGLQKTPPDPDVNLLQRVAVLPSYDVYSLRIALRACAIAVPDSSALNLSSTKIASLSAYMATFTRPLVVEIFGESTNVEDFTDLLGLFRNCGAQTVRARLATMADKLGIPVPGIPKFLEDYADIFMSLSYYKQCLDQLLPQVQTFMAALADIRANHQLRNDANLMKTLDFTEATVNGTLANITGRLESFDKSTAGMWRNLSAERFRKIEQLILSYHTVIGGVLCALSVKMNAWTRQFPVAGAAGPVRRAAFIMSDMRQGIDRISAIEDTRPVLSELND